MAQWKKSRNRVELVIDDDITIQLLPYGENGWEGYCAELDVYEHALEATNIEAAKREFLRFLKQRAWSWADKIAAAEVA